MVYIIAPAALILFIIIESALVFFNVEGYYRFLPNIKTHDYYLSKDHIKILRRLSGKNLDTHHGSYKIVHKNRTCYIKISADGRFPIPFFVGITRYSVEKDQINFLYTVKARFAPPLFFVAVTGGMAYVATINSIPTITDNTIGCGVMILATIASCGYTLWKDLESVEMAFFWAMEDIRMESTPQQEQAGAS